MASKRKLKAMAQELKRVHIPQGTIWELDSLADNFAYSLLNSKYSEIQGYSVVEMSNWLQAKGLQSDYDLLELIVAQNNNMEVSNGKEV